MLIKIIIEIFSFNSKITSADLSVLVLVLVSCTWTNLCECDTWSPKGREQHRLRCFRRDWWGCYLRQKEVEPLGEYRKLHKTAFHYLNPPGSNIRNIRSRGMGWVEHNALVREKRKCVQEFWRGNFFLSPSIFAIWARTFSNRVRQSLLMACRKYSQWYSSYFKLNYNWLGVVPHSWRFEITHNDTPQSVGLLWTSGQLVTETSTWQQHTTDRLTCPRWGNLEQRDHLGDLGTIRIQY